MPTRKDRIREELLEGVFLHGSSTSLCSGLLIQKLLDEGAFAQVYRATWRGQLVALKVLKVCARSDGHLQCLLREGKLLTTLRHPHIVQCLGLCQLPPHFPGLAEDNDQPLWCLLEEFMEAGSLGQLLLDQSENAGDPLYTAAEAARWALQVASALAYLHQCEPEIIHRDVKAINVLLAWRDGVRIAKLADFGLHVRADDERQALLRRRKDDPDADASDIFYTVGTDGIARSASSCISLATISMPQYSASAPNVSFAETTDDAMGAALGTEGTLPRTGQGRVEELPSTSAPLPKLSVGSSTAGTTPPPPPLRPLSSLTRGNEGVAPNGSGGPAPEPCSGFATASAAAAAALLPAKTAAPRSIRVHRTSRDALGGDVHLNACSAPQARVAGGVAAVGTIGSGGDSTADPLLDVGSIRLDLASNSTPATASGGAHGAVPRSPPPLTPQLSGQLTPRCGAQTPSRLRTATYAAALEAGLPRLLAAGSGSQQGTQEATPLTALQQSMGALQASSGAVASQAGLSRGPSNAGRSLRSSSMDGSAHQQASVVPSGRPSDSGLVSPRTSVAGKREGETSLDGRASLSGVGAGASIATATAGGSSRRRLPMECAGDSSTSMRSLGGLGACSTNRLASASTGHLSSVPSSDGISPLASVSAIVGNPQHDLALVDRLGSVLGLMKRVISPAFERHFLFVWAMTGHTGSSLYMAPEVFRNQAYNSRVDTFSFGVLLYEIFGRCAVVHRITGKFKDAQAFAFEVSAGYRLARPSGMQPELWMLIQQCWDEDPVDRPPMPEVLERLQQLQRDGLLKPVPLARPPGGKMSYGKLSESSRSSTRGSRLRQDSKEGSQRPPVARRLSGPANKYYVGSEASETGSNPAPGCRCVVS